jgi:hypothetical protein
MAVAAEVAAIRALEAAYDKARPAGDLDAMVRCLRGDAVVVSPRGEVARCSVGDLPRPDDAHSHRLTRRRAVRKWCAPWDSNPEPAD